MPIRPAAFPLPVKYLRQRGRFHGFAGCIANIPSTILQTGGGFGRRSSNIAVLKGAP
jgi:hypothetical protein